MNDSVGVRSRLPSHMAWMAVAGHDEMMKGLRNGRVPCEQRSGRVERRMGVQALGENMEVERCMVKELYRNWV